MALTDAPIANVVFNETRSLSGDGIVEARKNIVHSIINAKALPLVFLLGTLLAGCASAPLVKPPLPDASNRSEVIVLRDRALNAGGVGLTFGVDEQAYLTLSNGDYASVYVTPGLHRFFVQARSAEPTVLSVELKPGERRCLRTVADAANLGRAVVPLALMTMGYSFLLDEVKCPSAEQLSKRSRVDVEYGTR
jgi:hypothetical protein